MKINVMHKTEMEEFVAEVKGYKSGLSYEKLDEKTMDLSSTHVHPEVRGMGVGIALVEAALSYAVQNKLKIVPSCPFVEKFIEKSKGKYNFILADD